MKPRVVLALVIAGLASAAWMKTQAQAPARPLAHRFERLAEGVYAALPNGSVNVVSNSTIIVNDEDVIVVDAHATPAAARALIDDVKTLTPKPIRYVIDTHYHWDHAHGNQAFVPGAQVIGHEYVRQMLLTNTLESRSYRSFIDPVPAQLESIRKQLAAETDPAKKAAIEQRLNVQAAYSDALKEITPTPPTLTYETRMSMFRGAREIRLLFLGRGHTGGDTVVFLPKERIVATGDLVVGSLPFMYMGDGFVNEWPDTMEKVLQLDFDTIIPGHGDPFKDRDRLRKYQSYLRDLWKQAGDLKKQGLSSDDAAKKIDLTSHKADFQNIQGPGVDPRAMLRIYDVIDGRLAPR
jgi:glyoxylase-like metal-dependent hydrolase (beta-lactamase superfamily II)